MLTQTDPCTTAHVNLHAVLGALPRLVELVPEAAAVARRDPRPIRIAFSVHGGPSATLHAEAGRLWFTEGRDHPTILLPFTSPKAFNKVIDGLAQPVPVTGLHRVKFLLDVFSPLTDILTRYLRPSADDLADPEFRRVSTLLQLQVMGAAIAQVGNHDQSGKFSAGQMPDGDLAIEVTGGPTLTIRVADHKLGFLTESDRKPRAVMSFADLGVAGNLLSGELSAIAGVSSGAIAMRGMLSMVDNTNRILDRVTHYLAA